MELAYSYKPRDKEKAACGIARDLDMSFKDSVVICDALRGMNLAKAVSYLEEVVSMKTPVPYRKFNAGVGHRKNLNGCATGKYPKKAAQKILELLNNINSNAEYKGLDTDNLKITHIQAQKGITRRRVKPKGRWRLWKTELVHVQAVCEEK